MGDELLGEYSELPPVDWLDPLPRFGLLLIGGAGPPATQVAFGIGGGWCLVPLYALGWLALRARCKGGPPLGGICGELPPRPSVGSGVGRSLVELC
jgi:hypothetical protein